MEVKINVEKTKQLLQIVRKGGRLKNDYCWNYDNEFIDIVKNFNHLGISFEF